ncbi:Wzz/FepE/Etk N-terminal domain-containing protein [Litorilituus sediminis]|nr:Wzz/FepE/Etk N-terminal domain-containing protein [Litorilituus sediminis]
MSNKLREDTNIIPQPASKQVNITQERTDNSGYEVEFSELMQAIWKGKILIAFISSIFAISSIAIALSLPNIYKASAILAPVSSDSGMGGLASLAGKFGGLASMAGINLGGESSDKTGLALEVIKTRSFIEKFIQKHQLTVPLIAAKNWDYASNELVYDEDLYDVNQQKWVREVDFPKTPEPTPWEAYKAFNKIFTVSQSKLTSMVTIEMEFYSPELAQQWLTWLIEDINFFMREQDYKEAQDSINYLTEKLENIKTSNMETIFYQLIEEQTKNMMLTQVKAEYVLKTIDSPQVPDEKDKPKRALIVVLGTILGGVLSVLIVLFRFFSNRNNAL